MKYRIGKITTAFLAVLIVIGCICTHINIIVKAEPLDSYNVAWKLVRDTATEDGTSLSVVYDLAGAEGNWANRDADLSYRLMAGPAEPSGTAGLPDSPGAIWKFVISGGPSDDDTFSFDVLGWAQGNGMAQVICTGDGEIGTQDVVLYPDDSAIATNIWWADTINVDDTSVWPGVSEYNSGNNQVAMLLIDTAGLEYLQFVIYDADGSGTEANDVTVFGRPY